MKIETKIHSVEEPIIGQNQVQPQRKDYIGSLMSVVSKQKIRYVGTLLAINPKDQTLILEKVRSHGSEGRRGGGPDEIPAMDKVYEHIIFKAAELKDFYVIQRPTKEFKDPAIISSEAKLPANEGKKYQTIETEAERYQLYPVRNFTTYRRGRGQYRAPRFIIDEYSQLPSVKEKYDTEYDFETMNKKFQDLFLDQSEKDDIIPRYDKVKSFYDGISRGSISNENNELKAQKQRLIDMDTFDLEIDTFRGRGYRRGGYTRRGMYRGPRRYRASYRRRG